MHAHVQRLHVAKTAIDVPIVPFDQLAERRDIDDEAGRRPVEDRRQLVLELRLAGMPKAVEARQRIDGLEAERVRRLPERGDQRVGAAEDPLRDRRRPVHHERRQLPPVRNCTRTALHNRCSAAAADIASA